MTHSQQSPAGQADLDSGIAIIRHFAAQMSDSPGIYQMFDADDAVLYIGKARRLRARISSYTSLSGKPWRIRRMIALTARMSCTLTASEVEALLLEANAVKRFKPRFNVLLRDDKSFPYLLLTGDHPAPRLVKHRGGRQRSGRYFGPFASGRLVNQTLNTLQRGFLLRSCSDNVYANRRRPCMLHQIHRCSAPCTGEISTDAYQALAQQAGDFFDGKSDAIRDILTAAMQKAAQQFRYEQAAQLRDRLAALSYTQVYGGITLSHRLDADLFAIEDYQGTMVVEAVGLRGGHNWGDKTFFPRSVAELDCADVLAPFLAQYYQSRPPPPLLLLNIAIKETDLLAAALSLRAGRRVRIAVPQRGEKRNLIRQAELNARAAGARRLAETADQRACFAEIAKLFNLADIPERIEIYDNSHFQGDQALGAMVVANPEGFDKKSYRRFIIRSPTLAPGDDTGMLREVFSRRFRDHANRDRHGGKKTSSFPEPAILPDLILVDGGAGQCSSAMKVLQAYQLDAIPVIGIAKGEDRHAGRERFFMSNRPPFSLPERSSALYFMQRLRDEAHRFAISGQRNRRRKAQMISQLDAVPGVGPRRKQALLRRLGSARAVMRAPLRELTAVAGIDATLARVIYDYFHE